MPYGQVSRWLKATTKGFCKFDRSFCHQWDWLHLNCGRWLGFWLPDCNIKAITKAITLLFPDDSKPIIISVTTFNDLMINTKTLCVKNVSDSFSHSGLILYPIDIYTYIYLYTYFNVSISIALFSNVCHRVCTENTLGDIVRKRSTLMILLPWWRH